MNRPPRFILDAPPNPDGSAVVSGAEMHHMRDVMRLGADAEVTVLAPDGCEYLARIARFEKDAAILTVSSRKAKRTAGMPGLIAAAAVVKGPRMDFLVEKAAELGVAELWPVMCARGVVRAPGEERLARWRRLATAATKQSLSPTRMQVRNPIAFADLVESVPEDTLAVICTPRGAALAPVVRHSTAHRVLVATGPEGDFDPTELELARDGGFIEARLGATRLRSETAMLAALAIVAGAFDELPEGD